MKREQSGPVIIQMCFCCLRVLILPRNLIFFPVFDESCASLVVGEGYAVFYTLAVEVKNP